MSGPVAYTDRIEQLAAERGSSTAAVFVSPDGTERALSWSELRAGFHTAARSLIAAGVRPGQLVAVALPKREEHLFSMIGAWRIGARPLTINSAMPPAERVRIIGLSKPAAVVAPSGWDATIEVTPGSRCIPTADADAELAPAPLVANFAVATGGSTGHPKIIRSPFPGSYDDAAFVEPDVIGRSRNMVQLVNGPLFHNSPCTVAYSGLLLGHSLIVMERFDSSLALELIRRHQVTFVPTVPTVMARLLADPGYEAADLSTIETLFHTGSPCPPTVKRAWIERLGGQHVYEAFGGSELFGTTIIRGDEWLLHPGSVGRPVGTELRILDDAGRVCQPGEIGEIYMRPIGDRPRYEYVGADSHAVDGFETMGDLGSVDAAGYLYIADRRTDLIITGGENVYPAEVEAALIAHPSVADAVVIGLADPHWGARVHAIVELTAPGPSAADLQAHCRTMLSAYKVPKHVEIVERVPRDEAGKIRRSQLADERRTPGQPPTDAVMKENR